jgi:hypothetical protein
MEKNQQIGRMTHDVDPIGVFSLAWLAALFVGLTTSCDLEN